MRDDIDLARYRKTEKRTLQKLHDLKSELEGLLALTARDLKSVWTSFIVRADWIEMSEGFRPQTELTTMHKKGMVHIASKHILNCLNTFLKCRPWTQQGDPVKSLSP